MNNSLSDFNLNKKSPLRVVIGTPSIDGKLESHYVESLVETIRECKRHNVEIFPIFLAGESILHMARNKLIKIFYESSSQILVFIDSDQMWSPKVFLDVIKSKKSVLAVPVPLKTDIPKFNVGFDLNEKFDEKTNDFTVTTIGTGFFKMDKKIISELWKTNDDIIFKGENMKMIFEYSMHPSLDFISEDYFLCSKIRELGYNVWTNAKYISLHVGTKIYQHDFKEYRKKFFEEIKK